MSPLLSSLLQASVATPVVVVLKATVLLLAGATVALALRRRGAAARHLAWTLTLLGVLLLPLASITIPGWRVPVPVEGMKLPAESQPPSVASFPAADARITTPIVERPAEPAAKVVEPPASDAHAAVPAPSAPEPASAAAHAAAAPSPTVDSRAVTDSLSASIAVLALRRLFTPSGLGFAWLAGVACVVAWMLAGRLGLRYVLRRSRPLSDASWQSVLRDAAWMLDVDRPVRVHKSRSAVMPVTWGVVRPVVLLPEEAEAWPEERRRVVLLHELSHIARQDCLTQVLAGIACALYWFHPGVWYAARRLRVERERACDDMVLALGTPAPVYAAHLLELARRFRAVFPAPMVALHMARPKQLEGRLLAVLAGVSGRAPSRIATRAAALVALLLMLPLSALRPALQETKLELRNRSAPLQMQVRTVPNAASILPAPELALPMQRQDSVIERVRPTKPGERLDLDLLTGASVSIVGWDEDRVRVRVKLAGRDWRDTDADIAASADGVAVELRTSRKGSYSSSHELDIRVPRRYDVRIKSAGGSIEIRDVEGSFSGNTGGGPITLKGLKGEATLSTGGGEIEVLESELRGRVSTGGGRVDIRNVRGGLRGSSGSGDVTYYGSDVDLRGEADYAVTSSGKAIRIQKAGGTITLDKAPDGADVTTGGGAIRIGRSAGRVNATTGGGEIVIGPLNGSAKLSTGAGNVTVTVEGTNGARRVIEIGSGSGDVTLNLPPDFSGELDLETAYTESHAPTRIRSSWDLPIRESSEWDRTKGSPRRYVRSQSRLGNGSTVLRVRTVNGDIMVQRSKDRRVNDPGGGSLLRIESPDSVARIIPRVQTSRASFAMTSKDGNTMLLLLDSTIVLQLTDRGLSRIGKVEKEGDEELSFGAALVAGMLGGGLRVLLDRGIAYSLTDLRDARYEDGRLILESRDGTHVFDDTELNGTEIMASFPPQDARTFAKRANAARARLKR